MNYQGSYTKAISANGYVKNGGTVVYGGNVPASDRVTQFPAANLVGVVDATPFQYIGSSQASGIYQKDHTAGTLNMTQSGFVMMYGAKTDVAGVLTQAMANPTAGAFYEPMVATTGSLVAYPSGYNRESGTPVTTVVLGASYGADSGATGNGDFAYLAGGLRPVRTTR